MSSKQKEDYNIFQRVWNGVKGFFYDVSVKLFEKRKNRSVDKPLNVQKINSRKQRQKMLFVWGGLAIPIINFFIFYIYANGSALVMAFKNITPDNTTVYGFDNFRMAWNSIVTPNYGNPIREALINTLIYFAFSFFFMMPMCYLVSYFIYKKILLHKFFRYLFFMPSILSAVIMSSFFKYMVEPGGLVMRLLSDEAAGNLTLLLADSRYALGTLLFYNFWSGFGVNMIYFTATFNRIPQDILESARLEGVST